MLKRYLTSALILLSPNVMAWMCPSTMSQIAVGDTLATVEQQCGKPSSQTSSEKGANVPQEWTYYVRVNQPSTTPAAATSGSIKLTIAFVNDKAVNITVQANSLSSTSICGPTISVGDTSGTIQSACGTATFVQKQQPQDGGPKPVQIIEYKYNSPPPNTLIFENGILKDRK